MSGDALALAERMERELNRLSMISYPLGRHAISVLRTISARLVAAEQSWRCFHCGEVFTDEATARDHFGTEDEGFDAACVERLTTSEKDLRHSIVDAHLAMSAAQDECARLENIEALLHSYESELARYFKGARSPQQAYLEHDFVKGQVVAAEQERDRLKLALGDIRDLNFSVSGLNTAEIEREFRAMARAALSRAEAPAQEDTPMMTGGNKCGCS